MTDAKATVITPMLGKVYTEVYRGTGRFKGNDTLVFKAGKHHVEYTHKQDCCESVTIEDITGDLADLCGAPILMAEETVRLGAVEPKSSESESWTFYKFATQKGYVTVRWWGQSNGYYSEGVDIFVDGVRWPPEVGQ